MDAAMDATVIDRTGIDRALAFDRHFEQYGIKLV
jgi:predicted nucleic acid-binding protein